jgi:hypothetical protein
MRATKSVVAFVGWVLTSLCLVACQPKVKAKAENQTGLNLTLRLVNMEGEFLSNESIQAGGTRAIADDFLGCVDVFKIQFGVYGGSVVPAGKVIGTRDTEWCKGTWTIELLPAPTAG